jgi:hypothetical protein
MRYESNVQFGKCLKFKILEHNSIAFDLQRRIIELNFMHSYHFRLLKMDKKSVIYEL